MSIAVQGLLAVGAQILLALWLTPIDFGLFALFVSASFIFDMLAVGGIRTTLTQRRSEETVAMWPSAFRTSIALSSAAALGLILLSPVLARIFDEPALMGVVIVGALALPLGSFATVAIPMLHAHLLFGAVAVSTTITALVRYTVAISLASAGAGAMSLVAGAVAGAATLSLTLVPAAIVTIRRSSASVSPQRKKFRMAPWALFGDIAAAGSGRVDYFVLGLFAPIGVVGGYYFAFQLVTRVGQLLHSVSANVLFPALAQIQSDDTRQVKGLYRAGTLLVLVGGAGAAAVIASISTIEELMWRGRWAFVVTAVAVLASVLPMQIALAAPEQLLKARGAFRKWTWLLAARAGGIAMTALAVSLVYSERLTPTVIASALAGYLVVEAMVEMLVLSRMLSFSVRTYWKTVVPLSVWFVIVGWSGAAAAARLDVGLAGELFVAAGVVAAGSAIATVSLHAGGWLRSRSA